MLSIRLKLDNFETKLEENCEELRLYLNQLSDGTGRRRILLQDEDHSGNDPHSVSGLLRRRSENIPERFQIES